jgi:hypothetical protein
VEIARELGVPPDRVATHDFYARLYERWQDVGFQPEPNWIEAKGRIASILSGVIDTHNPAATNLLSVGAGLGLVEQYLGRLRPGMEIELQECQEASFSYLRRELGTRMPRTWVCPTLSPLPTSSYDVIFLGTVAYAFVGTTYTQLLHECRRLLRPEGIVVMWEQDVRCPPLQAAKRLARSLFRGYRDIAWGVLRSPACHNAFAVECGFEPLVCEFYDSQHSPIPPPRRWLGMQGFRPTSHAQCLVWRS